MHKISRLWHTKQKIKLKKGRELMKEKTQITNCHRTGAKYEVPKDVPGASDDSDQDSARSKYVVKEDKRERQDGPGGN